MGDRTDVGGGGVATFVTPEQFALLLSSDGDRHGIVGAFATAARLNALGMIQLSGSGHIGSSFSSLDILSYLFIDGLVDDDIAFSSKGHDVPGLYAVLIGLGRLPFDLVTGLRRLGGLPGHPDISTPGIIFNTGSLGMGISKAKGLIAADRIARRERRVLVLTGDGELQEGQIWESLPGAARDAMHELTVIVDHNGLQSDLRIEQVNDLGDLPARFATFGWDVRRVDGHDSAAVAEAIEAPREGPRVIIADTVKSRGVSFLEPSQRPAEERFYPFHSGALEPTVYAAARDELADRLDAQLATLGLAPAQTIDLPRRDLIAWPVPTAEERDAPQAERPPERLVAAYGRALLEAAGKYEDLVVLDADLMVDLELAPLRDAFPERFLECGIAEQDMVSQASGLAAGGMLPVVHSFATFLSARPMEQAVNAASEQRKIAYVGALAGILPASPGHSHQGLQDIGAFDRVGATSVAPSSELAVADAVRFMCEDSNTVHLRLCSLPTPLPFEPQPLPRLGTGNIVHEALDASILVLGYGPVLLGEAVRGVRADQSLIGEVRIIDLPWVNSVEIAWLRSELEGIRHLVVLDDHDIRSGLGIRLSSLVAQHDLGVSVTLLGVDGKPECGSPAEVLAHHGLDAASIAASIEALRD
jgi:transketolase